MASRKKNAGHSIAAHEEAVSRVEATLGEVENLVVNASHLPLTNKCVIDENDLIHLVEELRQDLPQELKKAREIMQREANIIGEAQKDAEDTKAKAQDYAKRLVEKETIMQEARKKASELTAQSQEKARVLISQAQDTRREILARTQEEAKQLRDAADSYAAQVFDQLIGHVTNTVQFAQQSVGYLQQSVSSIDQARGTLQQAKEQMIRGAAEAAAAANASMPSDVAGMNGNGVMAANAPEAPAAAASQPAV